VVIVVDVAAFHVFDLKPKGYGSERFFEFSPTYGHLHRPNVSGTFYRYLTGGKFEVSTNSHGFADSERSREKTRPRIALIGDSVTEFWEVEQPHRGQYLLEEELGGRYEVLNFGVRAYGTDQTYLLFRDVGATFDPDIVVYTFCVNDPADNVSKRGKPYFERSGTDPDSLVLRNVPVSKPKEWEEYGWLYEHSFIYRMVTEARNALMPGIRLRRFLGKDVRPAPHFELALFKEEYSASDRERVDLTLDLISMLHDAVTGRGMRFLLVEGLYKPMTDPETRRSIEYVYGDVFDPDKLTEILDSHCRREGIAFLSLPRVAAEGEIDTGELMHPRDNMHFNACGTQFFADAVASKLAGLGWVGDSGR
jgi:lysophospholipase L1-like esterase